MRPAGPVFHVGRRARAGTQVTARAGARGGGRSRHRGPGGTRGPGSGTSLRAVPGARGGRRVRCVPYTHPVEADPFTVLGLPARPEVGDDEVRAAWRRIAAATHPDRADGGDPARFAAAAAAYTTLRTRSGRGEALADLAHPGVPGRRAAAPGPGALTGPDPARTAGPAGAAAGRGGGGERGGGRRGGLDAGQRRGDHGGSHLAAAHRPSRSRPTALSGPLGRGRAPSGSSGRAAWPGRRRQPGSGPVATGRAGSVTQCDQEPT